MLSREATQFKTPDPFTPQLRVYGILLNAFEIRA